MQTRLDQRLIERGVLFATSDKGETGQISEHGSHPILAIEPEQGARRWDLMCCKVACDRREALAHFHSVASVASIAKTAEPLIAMSLSDHRARPNDLSTFAPRVARGTDVIQPPRGRGYIFALW